MEGASLYKSLQETMHGINHSLSIVSGLIRSKVHGLPVDYGQVPLLAVHGQQGEHGHVVLVEHNSVLNLDIRGRGLRQSFYDRLTCPSSEVNCLQQDPYLFCKTLARSKYHCGLFCSSGASLGSNYTK